MTVVDAGVLVDALVTTGPAGDAARAELRDHAELPAPAIIRAEATSALRDLVLRDELALTRALVARARVRDTRIVAYPFEPFADRVWDLRENLTVYDAWYVALAERLGVPLVTGDARLARAPGPRCEIRTPGAAAS